MPSWSWSMLAGIIALLIVDTGSAAEGQIAALGRIEPRGGVLRVAGPSGGPSVIKKLFVQEGDRVRAQQDRLSTSLGILKMERAARKVHGRVAQPEEL